MKTSQQHLSSFQKEQYTLYLETQLEKFSAFMLAQKKDNERNRHLEELIDGMGKTIHTLTDRIKMLEFYQKENFKQCERIQSENVKAVELDCRLKKVESRYFERPIDSKSKENNQNAVNTKKYSPHQLHNLESKIDQIGKETSKKIKSIEKQIENLYLIQEKQVSQNVFFGKRESQPVLTNYSEVNSLHTLNMPASQSVTKNELRATQNKIYSVFDKKFSKIQQIIHKSFKEKNKSSKKNSLNNSNNSSNIKMKEQTFGMQDPASSQRAFRKGERSPAANFQTIGRDQYELSSSHVKIQPSEKSYSISDTSQRLKPVTHLLSVKEDSVSKKSRKKKLSKKQKNSREISKSVSRSKSKSLSKSKSTKKESKVKKIIQQFKHETHHSPSIEKKEKSQSKSLGKSSRSKSTKKQKGKLSHSKKLRVNKAENSEYSSNKEYLMNCTKNHFASYI